MGAIAALTQACSPALGGRMTLAADSTAEYVRVTERNITTQGLRDCYITNDASDLALQLVKWGSDSPYWVWQVTADVYPGTEIFVRSGSRTKSAMKGEVIAISEAEVSALGDAPQITYSYTVWPYNNIVEKTVTFRSLANAVSQCREYVLSP